MMSNILLASRQPSALDGWFAFQDHSILPESDNSPPRLLLSSPPWRPPCHESCLTHTALPPPILLGGGLPRSLPGQSPHPQPHPPSILTVRLSCPNSPPVLSLFHSRSLKESRPSTHWTNHQPHWPSTLCQMTHTLSLCLTPGLWLLYFSPPEGPSSLPATAASAS